MKVVKLVGKAVVMSKEMAEALEDMDLGVRAAAGAYERFRRLLKDSRPTPVAKRLKSQHSPEAWQRKCARLRAENKTLLRVLSRRTNVVVDRSGTLTNREGAKKKWIPPTPVRMGVQTPTGIGAVMAGAGVSNGNR